MLRAREAEMKVINARNAAHWAHKRGFGWWHDTGTDVSNGHPVVGGLDTDSSGTNVTCDKGEDIVECWSENSSDVE
jgi:hypothetical protein